MSDSREFDKNRTPFFSRRDMYIESDSDRWSLLLFLGVGMLWVLRRLCLFENLKRIVLRNRPMPAVFLDVYLIAIWCCTAVTFCFFEPCVPHWQLGGLPELGVWLCFWVVVQVVQTSVYHELWRPARLIASGVSPDVSYSRLRNLLIGVCNYLFVVCLFGMIYWRLSDMFMSTIVVDGVVQRQAFDSLFDAVYFSFTVAWSCGSLGISPRDVGSWGQAAIIAQIISTLVLFSVLVSLAVAAIRSTGEKRRTPGSEVAVAGGTPVASMEGGIGAEGSASSIVVAT